LSRRDGSNFLSVATHSPIPVIDLFAGPGGLGEGFSALGWPEGVPRFDIRLSIEKEPTAHQTEPVQRLSACC